MRRHELNQLPLEALVERAREHGVDDASRMQKDELIDALLKRAASQRRIETMKTWFGVARDLVASVVDRGLHEKVYILAGITPMKSAGMARYMKNRVPGMDVPDEVVKRLSATPKEKQAEEGLKICVESIQRLKEVEGIAGFHIMAIEWEEKVPEIVEAAGLYPRPSVS